MFLSSHPGHQKGATLIEVLISLVIMSVGMLGVASLQLNAKRVNYDSVQRTLAANVVLDMVEKMRTNKNALDSYVTSGVGGQSISTPTSCHGSSTSCTSTDLAAYDLWMWERTIDGLAETATNGSTTLSVGGLVSPTGCITHNAGQVTISVAWYGSIEMSNPTANTCGEGLGKYGDDDERRQLFTLTTYIDNSF